MTETNKKIFISAGESSGDIHGANLMRCLLERDPNVIFYGLGKENMRQAGLHSLHDMSKKSLMWLHALTEISTFWKIKRDCVRFFRRERPGVVILIDYCGFNFHLARAAKKLGIPVVYYVCPQIWAHGPWRAKKMKKLVDKVIVIYPFEKSFYDKAGVPSVYAGHPLFDEICKIGVNEDMVSRLKKPEAGRIISFLPGSRKQEIVRLLPMFLRSASLIKQAIPSVRFIISCNDAHHLDLITALAKEAGVPYQIVVGNAHEIIKASDLCMASAGTVTLQIAYFGKPMIIAYKISLFACFIVKPFLTTPYIGLVNRLAGRMIVPERLMYRDDACWLAKQAIQLTSDEQKRNDCVRELSAIMEQIAKPGASARAAEEIATLLRHYYHDEK